MGLLSTIVIFKISNFLLPTWFPGCHTGACTLLEQRLQKSLLHLAGRHHVAELMLRAVVEVHWPVTSGPHVPMFQRFKQEWDQIDETAYQIGMDDESTAEILHEHKDDILVFIEEQFKVGNHLIENVSYHQNCCDYFSNPEFSPWNHIIRY